MTEPQNNEVSDDLNDLLDLVDDDLPTEALPVESFDDLEFEPDVPWQEDTVDHGDLNLNHVGTADDETPGQRRIRELQEELAKPSPEPTVVEEEDAPELTEEERQIQILEDQVARKWALELENAPALYSAPATGETILIHFLSNGFSASDAVWQRGQEVEFEVGKEAYEQTKDRTGWSWLELRNDPGEQHRRYGREYFREGPYPFAPIGDTTGITDPADVATLEKAALLERKRNRAAPIIRS